MRNCSGVAALAMRSTASERQCRAKTSPARTATWAARYEVGDVLRYSRASKETGIGKGEYARVSAVDASTNRLTIERTDGSERTYDPRRQQGVSVYREDGRTFSVGDRVQ